MLISSVWRGIGRSYFVVGLLVGGVVAALMCSLLGAVLFQWWIPPDWRAFVVASLLVAITGASPVLLAMPYLQNRRQVPEAVLDRGPRVGGFQFGFEMGTASRTFMTTTMPLVVLAGLLLVVALPTAAIVGLGFGLGRAAVPLLRSYDDYDLEWTASFDRWAKVIWLGTTLSALAGLVGPMVLGAR